jgi:DNA-binding NarL/FixJ family response regulator
MPHSLRSPAGARTLGTSHRGSSLLADAPFDWLAALLEPQADITVVATAADGADAVRLAAEHRPDVVLMDVRMPALDEIEATRQIGAAGGDAGPRILILTTFDLDEYVCDALHAGAGGFLLKDVPAETLFEAVRVIAAGDALLAPSITRRLIAEFARLGPREPPRTDGLEELTPRETEIPRARGRRPLQPRDRGAAPRSQRRDCEDAREPRPAQARAARPRAGGRHRLRVGAGRAARVSAALHPSCSEAGRFATANGLQGAGSPTASSCSASATSAAGTRSKTAPRAAAATAKMAPTRNAT